MRFKMPDMKTILSILLLILALTGNTWADRATAEKIRKHQEWLMQRNRERNNGFSDSLGNKKSVELLNLWRFDKKQNNPSINDVYAEDDRFVKTNFLTTSSPPTSSTNATSTTTTPRPSTTTTTTTSKPTTTTRRISMTTRPPTSTTVTTSSPRYSFSLTPRTPTEWYSNDVLELTSTSSTTSTTTTTTARPTTTPSTTTTTTTRKPRTRPYPRWNDWSEWSVCSRSCGGGVRYQQRKCINRNSGTGKLYLSKNCIGVYKRFELCNDTPCPPSVKQFRAEQCSEYDEVDFQGQQYMWEPYVKDDAECELNCKPVGMEYFATLNATVIDGTPCEKPAEYYRSNYRGRAMCIEGICKAVQAGGFVTGLSANSGAVPCGGLLCRPLTGLYTRDPLPEDAYIHVAMIPAGASNISITELKNSMNLLVLRTEDQKYVFNGDNTMSDSGAYEAAGAIFDYHRLDSLQQQSEGVTEWVTCTGPVRESLELMIYSKTVNPGIKYEYLLPITSDSEENEVSVETDGFLKSANDEAISSSNRPLRRRRYNWKVVGFSTCSKSCGGGMQSPVIKCVRENPLRYYSQRRCAHSEKPVINENLLRCNTQPCPAFWRLEDWGECRCHQGEGTREREVNCVQELASGVVVHVDATACMEEKPVAKKICDCPKNRRRTNARYRMHGLSPNTSQTHAKNSRDKAGIWLMSDWNQYCSSDCGPGIEYRTIYCDRTKANPDRCDFRLAPDTTRICDQEESCDTGEWFAGPWTPCNGNCFNLTRTRQVLCIENQLILDEEDCKPELKPTTMEKCSHEEVEYCGPRWHYSEWSECTKTCDGGTQRRSVKCLEYNELENILKESNKCRYSIREPIYRSCNTHKCDDLRYEQVQNDDAIIMPCTDAFTNCAWAVKAKLCSYEYYKQKCCYSCN
uniref:PLAC domain-containing protein n=1 Tax=Stomoxys calcitrans TaxID=35570 RepID=A0A1I8PD91_STOCA